MVTGKTEQRMKILITGGTGTFGKYFIPRFLEQGHTLIVFSRDEFKQYEMRKEYPQVIFIVGDVRDYERIDDAIKNHKPDLVIHAAALKQIDTCELNPEEAIKTNVLGAENVVKACIKNEVWKVLAISTDKAVQPINVMGMTKALQEKIFLNNQSPSTIFGIVRYGNIIGSRGSVIPYYHSLIQKNQEVLPITDIAMTRFVLTLEEAFELVTFAIKNMDRLNNCIFVKECLSLNILDIILVFGKPHRVIGNRGAEKVDEVLIHEEEMLRTVKKGSYYVITQDYQNIFSAKSFNSNTAKKLNVSKIKAILKKEGWL